MTEITSKTMPKLTCFLEVILLSIFKAFKHQLVRLGMVPKALKRRKYHGIRRVFDKSREGFGGSKASGNNGPSTKAYGQRSSSSSGEKRISGEGDGGRDSRNLRNDNGSSQSNRIGTDTERLKNLTDIQLDNLGLGALPKGVQ